MLKTKVPLRIDARSVMDDIAEFASPSRGRNTPTQTQRNGLDASPGARWRPRPETVATCVGAVAEPRIPGGYVLHAPAVEEEESPENLAKPLVPDNKAQEADKAVEVEEEKEVKVEEKAVQVEPAQAEVVPEAEVVKAVETAVDESATPLAKEPVSPLDIFSWVRHVTIPPGCTLPAGAEFTKTWKLKHFASGSELDFDTVKLVLKTGQGLGSSAEAIKIEYKSDDVVNDDEFEVSISGLKVPDTPGQEIVAHWRFEDASGTAYGQPLRLRLVQLLLSLHCLQADHVLGSQWKAAPSLPTAQSALLPSSCRDPTRPPQSRCTSPPQVDRASPSRKSHMPYRHLQPEPTSCLPAPTLSPTTMTM